MATLHRKPMTSEPNFSHVRFSQINIKGRTIMVGRKRKMGKREKNGRLDRSVKVDVVAVAASMPHRRWIPARVNEYGEIIEQRNDQKAENPFGRLALVGLITEEEYQAGRRFLTDCRKYKVVMDSPRENAPSLMGRLSKSDYSQDDAPIPFRSFKPMDDQEARTRRLNYDAAFCAAKTDEHGKPSIFALRVLNSVVVHEKELQPGDLPFLRSALGRLKVHYAKLTVRPVRNRRLTA